MIVSVYGRWDHEKVIPADAVEGISAAFRPDDESVCVWVDQKDNHILVVSIDVDAVDFEVGVDAGRSALAEAARIGRLEGRAVHIAAMTDEAQMTWSASDPPRPLRDV